MRGARQGVGAAALAGLMIFAGCGDDTSSAEPSEDPPSWQDSDICSLVGEDVVADLIGPDAVPQEDTADPTRPECSWTVEGKTQQLLLRLWQPPIPEVLTDGKREVAVGDRTGYVESEGEGFCNMHVEAEPAWLTVDLNVPLEKFQSRLCDVAAGTAEQVLAEVG